MELIVENDHGGAAVHVEFGADLSSHSLAELRAALGLSVDPSRDGIPLTDVALHRAMVFSESSTVASPHLDAGWRPDHRGRFSVLRPPLVAPLRPASPSIPEPPAAPEPPPPLPYATVVPMLALSALMAVMWSPMFAILSAASAMIPLSRALGPRVMMRRTRRRHGIAMTEHDLLVVDMATEWAATMAAWLEGRVWSPGELDRLVETATLRPWSRRLGLDDPLPIACGRGRLEPGQGTDAPHTSVALDDVPLTFEVECGLALTGDRADVLAVARWIGIETAYRFGPADLDLTVLTTLDRLHDWEWARWLPGLRTVAVDPQPINLACMALADNAAQHLVVVDGPAPTGPGAFARLLGGNAAPARVLWLGGADEVPAVCHQVVEVTGDSFVRSIDGSAAGWSWHLAAEEAEAFARFLAPFTDPDVLERVAPLPSSVPLAQLCPTVDGRTSEDALRQSWERARSNQLLVPIGVTAEGPLVLDFVADGPHALVAGTTGSGKSELLRSLVVGAAMLQSPNQLAFVLIDFKGGGAFDAVAGLPHVAAVVTDLEPVNAMRALLSLRAELHHRERLLRRHGVSDLADLPVESKAGFGAPPRLMVIVDEFAALADELPAFLDGLVDVARRGRSLGVHLVLATQRPAGVVTSEIRANTNLRMCLRVRDPGDSVDVIDVVDAASLPPIPGRAIVTVGGERRRLAQVAYLAGAPLLVARPFTLLAADASVDASDSWLARVIDLVARCHPTRMAAPWLPPLPPLLAAERLWNIGVDRAPLAAATDRPSRSMLGVLDDPNRRLQLPIHWSPVEGGLVVAGADPDRVAGTLATVVGSLALDAPDIEVLILDGSGGVLDRLCVLRSVGDVIHHRQPERLARALAIIERRRRETSHHSAPAMVVVINRWGPIVDALGDAVGPEAATQLARVFADSSIVPVIGVTSDRELPSKVLALARRRLVHQLADANTGLAFDVHPSKMPAGGAAVYDVEARLGGVIGDLSAHGLARIAAWSLPAAPPAPVQVLGDQMSLAALPDGRGPDHSGPDHSGPDHSGPDHSGPDHSGPDHSRPDHSRPDHSRPDRPGVIGAGERRWSIPIAFDEEIAPVFIELVPHRRFVILGRPGSGRTTALETVLAGLARLGATEDVEVIDDADRIPNPEGIQRLADADAVGRPVIIAATPASTRAFGSWLGPMLSDATVLFLNPSRFDAETLRVIVPDLSQGPPGRSVLLDRGRVTIVHVAIDLAA